MGPLCRYGNFMGSKRQDYAVTGEFWHEAGRLKAVHRKISLADCRALALAKRLGANFISADRHEFEPLLAAGIRPIEFIPRRALVL